MKQEMVTITKEEYERLKKLEELRLEKALEEYRAGKIPIDDPIRQSTYQSFLTILKKSRI